MSDLSPGLTNFTGFTPAFTPEGLFRAWQTNMARALQAQERMLQGFTAAAELELRYSQDYAARRLGLLKWDAEAPASPQTPLQEIEKILTLSREVAEELRGSFTEAAKLLQQPGAEEEALEDVAESPAKAAHRPPPHAAKHAAGSRAARH